MLICPECGEDMTEIQPDVHRCGCGFTAEQLTIGDDAGCKPQSNGETTQDVL